MRAVPKVLCLIACSAWWVACSGVGSPTPDGVNPDGAGGSDGTADSPRASDSSGETDASRPTDGGAHTDVTMPGDALSPPADGGQVPNDANAMPCNQDVTPYVNQFMGSGLRSDGQLFPSAARPFGMIQWAIDNALGAENTYDYDNPNFAGFSFLHYSGYEPRMGTMLPYAGTVTNSPAAPGIRTIPNTATVSPYESTFQHQDEVSRPGYYQVQSATGINVAMSVTDRAGLARITWPSNAGPSSIFFDPGNSPNSSFSPTDNQVTVDVANDRVQGFVGQPDYHLYFVLEFDQPITSTATLQDSTLQTGQSSSAVGTNVGAVITFAPGATVNIRAGLSFVGTDNAQMNRDAEIPQGTTLDQVSAQATARWNEVLGRVCVRDPNATMDELQKFYTQLYFPTLQPNLASDVDGEYWGADNQSHGAQSGHAEYTSISTWDQGQSGMWQISAWLYPSIWSDVAQSYIDSASQQASHSLPGFMFPFLAGGQSGGFGLGPEWALPAEVYAFGAQDFDTTTALTRLLR